jgi:putative lipoic acid-binding regulatory protein
MAPLSPDSPLQFPCSFPLKAFGEDTPEFAASVREIVARHVPGLGDAAFSRRQSREGRYVSITVTFTAESREQLDAIYRELSENPRVLMAL